MNKGDLVEVVASSLNETKAQASRTVDAVLEGIAKGVLSDGKVTITGFGSFEKKKRAARTGVNPHTKEPIQIAASTTVGFKPSQALKNSVQGES